MSDSEPRGRLEELWAGSFGDRYVERNIRAEEGREQFWNERLDKLQPQSALEVGSNVGANLCWIASRLGAERVAGVDINERALEHLRDRIPGVDARLATATKLPFTDRSFDLVFTIGVLIHLSTDDLPKAMREIVRCSVRWVLCGEYYAEEPTEVPYREQRGALFKRDYAGIYLAMFPELRLHSQGFL